MYLTANKFCSNYKIEFYLMSKEQEQGEKRKKRKIDKNNSNNDSNKQFKKENNKDINVKFFSV